MNVFKAVLNSLKKTWSGEEKFWKVFWLWGILGNILFWWLFIIINSYSTQQFLVSKLLLCWFFFYFVLSCGNCLINKNYSCYTRLIIILFFIILNIVFVITTMLIVSFSLYGINAGLMLMGPAMILRDFVS